MCPDLDQDRTCNPLLYRTAFQPTEPPGWGSSTVKQMPSEGRRPEWISGLDRGKKTKIKVAYTHENNKIKEYDKLTCVSEVQKEKKRYLSLIFQLGDPFTLTMLSSIARVRINLIVYHCLQTGSSLYSCDFQFGSNL